MAEPDEPTRSVLSRLDGWGNSSLAPSGLATLIAALHLRPPQYGPLVFVPVLLFSSYANLQGFRIDSAGITAAASGTYALLALRRRSPGGLRGRFFSVRGAVRGGAVALGGVNTIAGGWTYAKGNRQREKEERRDNPRWG